MRERKRRHDDAHRPMGGRGKRATPPKSTIKDDDESFADRAIQAELDHAMGVDNDDYDWLVEPYK